MTRPRTALVLGLLALLAVPAALPAQGVPGGWQAGVSPGFETYGFIDSDVIGLTRISLVTLPIVVRGSPLDRLQLQLTGAWARGTITRTDGSDAVLAGPTDTELRASYSLGRDRVVITAAYALPTGSGALTLEEAEVAGTIAADLLPFRVSHWGSGGGLTLGTSVAAPVGPFAVGLGVGYTLAQEFDALAPPGQDAWSYRPGNELRLRLAVDRPIGPAAKGSLVFSLRQYTEDRLGGESLVRPGARYDVTGSYSFVAGPAGTGVAYLGLAHRNAGSFAEAMGDDPFFAGMEIPAQDLVFAGAGFRLPLAGRVLVPTAEARLFRRSDGLNQGHLLGIGAALELPLGAAVLVPSVRTRFGRILLWQDEDASFRGGEIAVAIRAGGGRP
jgi:hypothetical protein